MKTSALVNRTRTLAQAMFCRAVAGGCNLTLAACGWMIATGTTLAQDAPAATPPLPPALNNKFDDAPIIMMYLGGALVLVVVIAAGMMPSKRGHQD